jgi:hypothetical protein
MGTKQLFFRADDAILAAIEAAPGKTTSDKIRSLIFQNREISEQIARQTDALRALAAPLENQRLSAPQNAQSDALAAAEFRSQMAAVIQILIFILSGVQQPASITREGYQVAANQIMQRIRKGEF